MFTTITAKFTGTCKRCKGTIQPGERIRYGGYGKTYHFASDCGPRVDTPEPQLEARAADTRPSHRVEEPITGILVTDSLAGRF